MLVGTWNPWGWELSEVQLIWMIEEEAGSGNIPIGWGLYLAKAEELTVGSLGPSETQRCQGNILGLTIWVWHLSLQHNVFEVNLCYNICTTYGMITVVHSFLLLISIPFYIFNTICLSIYLWKELLILPSFCG